MASVKSEAFRHLVQGLKTQGKKISVIESCCGGLINASIMAVPGSSAVYYGGSVAYNTKNSKPLLLNNAKLHQDLLQPLEEIPGESEGDAYIRSKMNWTAKTAVAFCEEVGTDYAIAEGGASGPTFRPKGLDKGFAVVALAGRNADGNAELLAQSVIRSTHADREGNMRLFADAAAKLTSDTLGITPALDETSESKKTTSTSSLNRMPMSLDRATALRSDKEKLEEMESRSDAKFIVLRDATECLFESPSKLALLQASQIPETSKTFLGLDADGAPIFAIDLAEASKLDLPDGVQFSNTRTHAPLLSEADNELALYATAMANWKRTHKFCAGCGQPLHPIHGGTCLKCSSCGTQSWPRQDPSIIVLITNRTQDKALLARSARHPKKVHTALAGFVEAGEDLEKAVVRESFEETGIHVDWDSIQYISSQPWPFPRSTMIGFRATADEHLPLCIDENELVSASWFSKDDVAKAAQVPGAVMQADIAEKALSMDASLQLLIPPKGVLARTLVDNWLEDAPI